MDINDSSLLVKLELELASSKLKGHGIGVSDVLLNLSYFLFGEGIIDSFPEASVASVGRYLFFANVLFLTKR